jgi:hypothetical protein
MPHFLEEDCSLADQLAIIFEVVFVIVEGNLLEGRSFNVNFKESGPPMGKIKFFNFFEAILDLTRRLAAPVSHLQ